MQLKIRFPSDNARCAALVGNIHNEKFEPQCTLICSVHFKEQFINWTEQGVELGPKTILTRFKKFAKHLVEA